MRYEVGRAVVDFLEALGLHGYRLFLAALGIALALVWLAWRIGSYRLVQRKSRL